MTKQLIATLTDPNFGANAPEGKYLPMALDTAVPLWMMQYQEWSYEQRQAELKRIESSDFCLRMEYVFHKGPKEGDTAKAFNDLAKTIALLSFCPGGITTFGRHYEWKNVRNRL